MVRLDNAYASIGFVAKCRKIAEEFKVLWRIVARSEFLVPKLFATTRGAGRSQGLVINVGV